MKVRQEANINTTELKWKGLSGKRTFFYSCTSFAMNGVIFGQGTYKKSVQICIASVYMICYSEG